MIPFVDRQYLNNIISAGRPMTELEFFAREITDWAASPERKEMLDGKRYYKEHHAIQHRRRQAIGEDGKLVDIDNLPNNRITYNLYAKHVDQKTNYLLGKPVTFKCENKQYSQELKTVLGTRFMRTLRNAGEDCFNCGISWLYPYFDKNGELAFRYFSGADILPFWKDEAHTEIDAAVRLYLVEVYEGQDKKLIQKADIFKPDGIATYILRNGVLEPDTDQQSYVTADGKPYNWEHFPLIPIKYNSEEIPLIRRARSLQDAINLLLSNFVNGMEEDSGSAVLVLKNYDGQDLGEFRHNLAVFRAIKTRTFEGKDGGVDSIELTVNSENYKVVLDLLKKALIENMRSYDAKDDRLAGNPNQLNIRSMYSDIDLDANAMEVELQAAFEEILWFVNAYLASIGHGDFSGEDVTVIFDRDILINESEAIDNCGKSVGIISDETIRSMHPWVDDPATEEERMKAQKEEAESDPYRNAFENAMKAQEPKADEE